ncbi:unnamed protein product [Adineta steineri]|uniref:F-box domain-containing protein n=1 Tax=Adineta steineri TaxID=433720 RepID=A0A814NDF4_9BILA|nr:unnamed protein product [Adineta steineri]CAF1502282.1 unnamed protein product [Adineta steineri]
MNLESLANELLLDLFEYFSMTHLLQSFDNLNIRFNNLISLYYQTHTLNLQSISKYYFDLICQKYIPSITNRINSLQLSDDDDTPQQIDLFFSYGLSFRHFSHLKSLSIYRFCSLHLLERLMNEILYLHHLTYLKIIRYIIKYTEIYDIGIISLIERLSKLTYCYFDITHDNDGFYQTSSIISTSLNSLSLPYLECNLNQLISLIKNTFNLYSLQIRINDFVIKSPIPLIKFLSIKKLNINFLGSLNIMKNLLRTMPNLEELKIELQSNYINGYEWESIIENNLLYLIKLQFKMSVSISNQNNKEEEIDEILNSFRSEFWIIKHQWFVQCNWNPIKSSSSTVHVYTLPYAFKNFFFMGNSRLKSTYPDNNYQWSFDCIHNLYYNYLSSQNLPLFRMDLRNIRHLDITIPFDNSFWLIVSTLNRLQSLSIVSYNDMNSIDIQSNLEILFERSPYLHSLKYFSWFVQIEFVEKIKHLSIRRLGLQGPHMIYNQEQCLELCHSFMGQQCEVLSINVQQRTDIINLINNMKNLRALSVKCSRMTLTEEENQDLIQWLQQNLRTTCSISNSTDCNNNIRIWIR